LKKPAPIPLVCLLLAFASPVSAAEVAYTLDPAHTETQFSWAHLGYSHPGAGFDDISGSLRWNTDDMSKSSVTVSIAVDSIHTHVPALDQELRSAKFFDTGKYPKIMFASTRVERSRYANRFKVTGDLTVHGVTRPVVLDVTLNQTGVYPMLNVPAMGFAATTSFKRSDFGVGFGVPMVGDEIRVQISTEALEAEGFAKAMKALSEQTPPQKN
jgi:polyisoprenoid-binding protein YceI